MPMQTHPGWTQFIHSDAWRAQVMFPLTVNAFPVSSYTPVHAQFANATNLQYT